MAYILNKTNGSVLATISNGTLDQTTDLVFVGKNYAGYGREFNENLLKLLENFSSGVAPQRPISGQLWYDSVNKAIKVYDGIVFRRLPSTESATTSPNISTVNKGDFWWDSNNDILNVFNGTKFISIGPSASAMGSFFKYSNVSDIVSGNHTVAEHTIYDNLIFVTATDDFYPIIGSVNTDLIYEYGKFKRVRKGITLKGADDITGVSSDGTDGNCIVWGTSADALRLTGMQPTTDSSIDTIAARDFNGDITANVFHGTATAAYYADLAERYEADAEYEEGTVLVVGGNKEVTTTTRRADTAIAGIVSKNPAFRMNSEAGTDKTHPYIALKGRVLCKIVGNINKGDLLVSSEVPGYATAYNMYSDNVAAVVGRALVDFKGSRGVIEVKV